REAQTEAAAPSRRPRETAAEAHRTEEGLQMRTTWSLFDTTRFLQLTSEHTAAEIASRLGRTKAAVESKRRQVKRLRELGVRGLGRLARLLTVPENFAQRRNLAEIEQHAR